jgi:hypothetical protein
MFAAARLPWLSAPTACFDICEQALVSLIGTQGLGNAHVGVVDIPDGKDVVERSVFGKDLHCGLDLDKAGSVHSVGPESCHKLGPRLETMRSDEEVSCSDEPDESPHKWSKHTGCGPSIAQVEPLYRDWTVGEPFRIHAGIGFEGDLEATKLTGEILSRFLLPVTPIQGIVAAVRKL